MLVSRQKAFLFLLLGAIGCSDTIGPKMDATFELVNVSGRPLPTYFSATPGLTSTIVSAYLVLQTDGTAFWTETRRDAAGALTGFSNLFEYRIRNDGQIEVGSFEPCAPNANCVGTYKGVVSNNSLSLVIASSTEGSVTYNYRTTPGIPFD